MALICSQEGMKTHLYGLMKEKRPERIYRSLKSSICSEMILPTSGEQFNVLLRTSTPNRRMIEGYINM
jgi:hypothetical protein